MKKNIARKVLSASFLLSTVLTPVLGAASPAEAATRHCRNVTIKVENESGEEIKITDIDYYDPDALGDWRSEPIANSKVSNGDTWEKTRRLEKVKGQETRIRLDYKLRDDNGWGYTRHIESDTSVCNHGDTYTVTVAAH